MAFDRRKITLGVNIDSSNAKNQLDNFIKTANTKGKVDLNFDTEFLNKLKNEFDKLSNIKMNVSTSGAVKEVQTLKNSLGEVLKITSQFSAGKEELLSQTLSLDSSVKLNTQKQLYKELTTLMKQSYDLKKQMINAEGEYLQELNKEYNLNSEMRNNIGKNIVGNNLISEEKNIELLKQQIQLRNKLNQVESQKTDSDNLSKLKEEQDLIKAMADFREKSEIKKREEIKKTERAQTNAINKAIEENAKEKQSQIEEQEQVQKLIQNKIKLLEIEKQSMQRRYGNSVDVSIIDQSISKLKAMDNISLKNLKNEFTNINTALKGAKENAAGSIGIFESLKNALGNVGIYINLADVLNGVFSSLKNGVQYVKYLDSSFVDMNITMDISQKQFNDMGSSIDEIAKKLGTTIESVHDIGRVFANDSETPEGILDKVKSASELSNVADMSAIETTKNIQSIANQFKMLDEQGNLTGEAITHIGDVLVGVSKSMKMDFTQGVQELNSAIRESGSVASQAGMSYEKFTAMVGAAEQQTGKSASEIANAFKTITARTLQQKSLTDELGINEKDLSNASKALKMLNIEISDGTNGGLRSIDSILEDVAKKWQTMNDATKQYVSYQLAGVRQSSVFAGIMDSMTTSQNLYNEALKSTGALEEANDKKAESIQGKMNTLQDTIKQKWSGLINSDQIKGAIDSLTELIDKFGNLETVIGLTTTAFLLFKGKAITNAFTGLIADIGGCIAGESALTVATVGVKTAFEGLSTVFASNPIGLVALAVSGAIVAIDEFGNKAEESKKKIDELNKSISSRNKEIENITQLKKTYEELSGKTNATTEEVKKLQDAQTQLAEKLPGIVEYYDAEGNAHLKNASAIDEEIKKKRELNAEDNKKKLNEYQKQIEGNRITSAKESTFGNILNLASPDDYKKHAAEAEQAEISANLKIADSIKADDIAYQNLNKSLKAYIDNNNDLKNKANDLAQQKITVQDYAKAVADLSNKFASSSVQDALKNYQTLHSELSTGKATTEQVSQAYEGLKIALMEAGMSEQDINRYMSETTNVANTQKNTVDNLTSSVSELGKTYDTTNNKVKGYEKILEELNNFKGNLSADTWGTIINKYPELLAHMKTASDLQSYLNSQIKKGEEERKNLVNQAIAAYNADTIAQTQSENAKQQNIKNTQNTAINSTANTVDTNAKNYNIDGNNHAKLESNKQTNTSNAEKANVQSVVNRLTANASNYGIDAKNHESAEGSKVQNSNNAGSAITGSYNNLGYALSGIYNNDLRNFASTVNRKIDLTRSAASQIQEAWRKMTGASARIADPEGMMPNGALKNIIKNSDYMKQLEKYKAIQDEYSRAMNGAGAPSLYHVSSGGGIGFSGVGFTPSSYSGVGVGGSSYKPSSFKPSKSNSGSNAKSNSGSNAKSAKETVNDIKLERDAYKSLEISIQEVDNAIANKQASQNNKETKESLNYEIWALGEKKKLQQQLMRTEYNERARLLNLVKRDAGRYVSFNADGTLKDYNGTMAKMEKWANSGDTKTKKKRQAVANEWKQNLADYLSLLTKTGDTTKAISDTQNEIIAKQTEFVKLQMENVSNRLDKTLNDIDLKLKDKDIADAKILDGDNISKIKSLNERYYMLYDTIRANEQAYRDLQKIQPLTAEGAEELNKKLNELHKTILIENKDLVDQYMAMADLVKQQEQLYLEKQKELEQTALAMKQEKDKNDLINSIYKVSRDEFNKYKEDKIKGIQDEIDKLTYAGNTSKETLEQIRIKTLELSAAQDEQYDYLENTMDVYKQIHQQNIDNIQKEIDAINEKSDAEDEAKQRLEKQNELIKLQTELQNIQNNKNVKVKKKNADGSYSDVYTYDQDAYDSKNEELKKAQQDYADWELNLQKKKDLEKLNQEKQAEEDMLSALDSYYKTQQEKQEKNQKKETYLLEKKYQDMTKLTNDFYRTMRETYGEQWDNILDVMKIKTDNAKAMISEMNDMQNEVQNKAADIALQIEKAKNALSGSDLDTQEIPISERVTQRFASGGYTGDGEGLAYLDKKELILKDTDTENILKAIQLNSALLDSNSFNNMSTMISNTSNSSNSSISVGKVEIRCDNVTNTSGVETIRDALINLPQYIQNNK